MSISSATHFTAAARAIFGTAGGGDTAVLSQFLESDFVELVHSRRLSPGLRASLHSSHLASTMQSSSIPSTPMGSRFPLTTLSQQPLILQVNDVSDVSMALAGRVGAVKGGTRGDAAAGPTGGSRLLKLLLTDGHDIITAIEVRSCAPLSQVKLGSKIAIAPGCIVRWLGANTGGGGGPEPTHCTFLLTPDAVLGVGGIVRDLALQHHKLQRQVASSLEGRAPQKQRLDNALGAGGGEGGPSSGRAEEVVHAVASTVRYAPTKTTLLSANRHQNSNSNPPIQYQQPPIHHTSLLDHAEPPQPVPHQQPHPHDVVDVPPPRHHPKHEPIQSVIVAEDVDDWDEDVPLIVAAASRAVSSSQAPPHTRSVHTTPTPRPPSQPQNAYSVALRRIAGGGGGGGTMERVVAEVVLGVVQYCCIREVLSGIQTRSGDVSTFESIFTGADGIVCDNQRFMMLAAVDGGGGGGGQVVDLGHDLISSEVLKGRWSPREFMELAGDASRRAEYGDVMTDALASLSTLPPLYMTLLPITHPEAYEGSTARPVALAVQASPTPPTVWEEAADVVLVVDDEDL